MPPIKMESFKKKQFNKEEWKKETQNLIENLYECADIQVPIEAILR